MRHPRSISTSHCVVPRAPSRPWRHRTPLSDSAPSRDGGWTSPWSKCRLRHHRTASMTGCDVSRLMDGQGAERVVGPGVPDTCNVEPQVELVGRIRRSHLQDYLGVGWRKDSQGDDVDPAQQTAGCVPLDLERAADKRVGHRLAHRRETGSARGRTRPRFAQFPSPLRCRSVGGVHRSCRAVLRSRRCGTDEHVNTSSTTQGGTGWPDSRSDAFRTPTW